jgi:hypothetical protein
MGRISSVIESILREGWAFRNQQLCKKLFEPDRRELYSKLYLPDDEPRILSGPFAGMKYINTPGPDLVDGIEKVLELRFMETRIIRRRPIIGRVDWCTKNNEVWSNRLTSNDVYRATNEFRTINQVWLWLQIRA